MRNQMIKFINRDGYVQLSQLQSDIKNKQAINSLDVMFTTAGIMTDLLTPGLVLINNSERDTAVKQKIVTKYDRNTLTESEDLLKGVGTVVDRDTPMDQSEADTVESKITEKLAQSKIDEKISAYTERINGTSIKLNTTPDPVLTKERQMKFTSRLNKYLK